MTCFAAGMLVSLALCHILPEANEAYDEYAEKTGSESSIPVPNTLCLCGFLLILMLD
jgi:zinc transporter ZupT